MEASVGSALFLLLEGICFVFHQDYCKIVFSYKFTVTFFQKMKDRSGSLLAKEQFLGLVKAVCAALKGDCLCLEESW